jgi:uncharacterized small protein (TIGR04563 family)
MNTASEKNEQRILMPEPMLQEIVRHAQRLDRSLSWCAQRAWRIARADIFKLVGDRKMQQTSGTRYSAVDTSRNLKQTLFFPLEMLDEIRTQAKRQDRTISSVMQQAWHLAISEIEKTPSS